MLKTLAMEAHTHTGFVLVADMVFVQQSAGRILRAMFEICLKRGWAVPAKAALEMCKMVDRRMWGSMTPLRQFKRVPGDVIRKAEGKQFVSRLVEFIQEHLLTFSQPWYRYFDLVSWHVSTWFWVFDSLGRVLLRLAS